MATIFLSVIAPDAPTTKTYGEGEDALVVNVPPSARDCVQATCIGCGRDHDKVWMVTRSMQPWGHFATAVINPRMSDGRFGRSEVIDASLPHVVAELPKDAIEVGPEAANILWHEDNESHVFGGPNVAKALRERIAELNGARR